MVGQRFEPLQGKGDAAVKRALSGGQILGPWFEEGKNPVGGRNKGKAKKEEKGYGVRPSQEYSIAQRRANNNKN